MGITALFEPEELIGGLWHRLVGDVGREIQFPDALVSLKANQRRLEIFFRGIGGQPGVVLKPIAPQSIDYRKKRLAQIAHGSSLVTRARFDGDILFLPETIQYLPTREDNGRLYKWLTAFAATAGNNHPQTHLDPLQNDLAFMRFALGITDQLFALFPGLKVLHDSLRPKLAEHRPERSLPEQEAAIENCILAALQGRAPTGLAQEYWKLVTKKESDLTHVKAQPGYKTFLPLILWGEVMPTARQQVPTGVHPKKKKMRPPQSKQNRSRHAKHHVRNLMRWSVMIPLYCTVLNRSCPGPK